MINYELEHLFKEDSVDKQILIKYSLGTITNEDLFSESIEITESICSEQWLTFGSCESNKIQFKCANITTLKDKEIEVSIVLDKNYDEPFIIGRYKVYSDVPTADRKWREILAYDAMQEIIDSDVKDWYNALSFPIKMRDFRRSFVNHFELQEEDTVLANDEMMIEKTLEPESLSGLDVISCICEINGCFGNIGRNGKFQYIKLEKDIDKSLYPKNDLYPSDEIYPVQPKGTTIEGYRYISCTYEDYLTSPITQLEIKNYEAETTQIIVGSQGNKYIVSDNFLLNGKSESEMTKIANNMLSQIVGISYRPFDAQCLGNLTLEVGDAIRFRTTYDIVESYILQRKVVGIQRIVDEYIATGEKDYFEKLYSFDRNISDLRQQTYELEQEIAETTEEIKVQLGKTESGILGTVAGAMQIWDTENYEIIWNGYGFPDIDDEELSVGDYYLDQSEGNLYVCESLNTEVDEDGNIIKNTGKWKFVKKLGTKLGKVESKMELLPHSIELSVSDSKGSASITISVKDGEGNQIGSTTKSISIDADTIDLSATDIINIIAGNTLNLTSNRISISSNNFSVDENGNVSAYSTKLIDGIYLAISSLTNSYEVKTLSIDSGMVGTYGTVLDFVPYHVKINANKSRLGLTGLPAKPYANLVGFKIDGKCEVTDDLWVDKNFLVEKDIRCTGKIYSNYTNEVATQSWVDSQNFAKGTIPDVSKFAKAATSGADHALSKNASDSLYYWHGTTTSPVASRLYLPSSNPWSDKRVKNNIEELQDISDIYLNLKVYRFKYDERLWDVDDRWHYGILAQEVEENLNSHGMTLDDSGIVYKEPVDKGTNEDKILGKNEFMYRASYDDYHAMHIQMIQKAYKKIDSQQKEIDSLKKELEEIRKLLKER